VIHGGPIGELPDAGSRAEELECTVEGGDMLCSSARARKVTLRDRMRGIVRRPRQPWYRRLVHR
jgi:hypothetical protein